MARQLTFYFPLFLLLSFGIAFTGWWIVNSQHFVIKPRTFSFAITFDICILIPLLYYFIIRNTKIPKLSLLPVFLISIQIASFILPHQQHLWIDRLELSLIPVEMLLTGWLIFKIRNGIQSFRHSKADQADTLLYIRDIVTQESGSKRFGNILGSEIAIFYYLFFAKQEKRFSSPTAKDFTYHKRIAYGTTVGVFSLLIVVETFALHLLLIRWHPVPAWIASLSSVYVILFLIADLRAVQQRPILIQDQYLCIRVGLRWFLKTPMEEIESIKITQKTADFNSSQKMVLFGEPNVLLSFKSEQEATGMYGIKKRFTQLGLQLDQPKLFAEEIRQKLNKSK